MSFEPAQTDTRISLFSAYTLPSVEGKTTNLGKNYKEKDKIFKKKRIREGIKDLV